MKVIHQSGNTHVLAFERGEEVIEGLAIYCGEQGVTGATFTAIGAVNETTLAYYDLEMKQYITKGYSDTHELVSCTGNVSVKPDGSTFVHAHGVIADKEMHTYGGHIQTMTTAVTCEVILQALDTSLTRTHDEDVGLDLLG